MGFFLSNCDIGVNYGRARTNGDSIYSPDPRYTSAFAPEGLNLGQNLSELAYWGDDAAFADLSKILSTWWAVTDGISPQYLVPFQADSKNYPLTDGQTLVAAIGYPGYPGAIYQASWDHDANTNLLITTNQPTPKYLSRTDTPIYGGLTHTVVTFERPDSSWIRLKAVRVQPTNPKIVLSNLHIIAPEKNPDGSISYDYGMYRPEFLERLRPFSTIRFMGWMNTNDSDTDPWGHQVFDCPAKEWSDRTLPDQIAHWGITYLGPNGQQIRQSGRAGVAYEEIIELANVTGKDIWINIPDCATDDHVRKMAQLFRELLNPQSKVLIEYSNETWNWGFSQIHHLIADAKANPEITATWDLGQAVQQTAFKLKHFGDIFRETFGSRAGQIKTVLAAQVGWPEATLNVELQYLQSKYGDPKQYISYLAGAPYFDVQPQDGAAVDQLSLQAYYDSQQALRTRAPSDQARASASMNAAVDRILASLQTSVSSTIPSWIARDKLTSNQYGIPFIAYEGGQSLTSAWNALYHQDSIQPDGSVVHDTTVYYHFLPKLLANRDPRMGQLYKEFLSFWKQTFGTNLFVHLSLVSTPNNFGYWGLLENMNDRGSVKWDAVMSSILPAGDVNLDGQVTYDDFVVLKNNFGKKGMFWQDGDFNGDGVVDRRDLELMYPNLKGLTPEQGADFNNFANTH